MYGRSQVNEWKIIQKKEDKRSVAKELHEFKQEWEKNRKKKEENKKEGFNSG